MKEIFEKLVKDKSEIETEEITTIKMLIPVSFKLIDGKCEDEETQALFDFLSDRDDVAEEEVAEAEENTSEYTSY